MRKVLLLILLSISVLLITSCGGGGSGNGNSNGNGTIAGSATLQWGVPAVDTDGGAITVTGYKIYYGTESGNYTNCIDVGNVNTYRVLNLPAGFTYYFVVTAMVDGVESDPTNEQSKKL